MYSKVYGKGRNYNKQNTMVLRNRTLMMRNEFYRREAPSTVSISLYGNPRRRDRPHIRDSALWEKNLDEKDREKLEAFKEEEKEKEDKLRVEESEVEIIERKVLMVKEQNLHAIENAMEHKTDEYDCVDDFLDPQVVVRRGQEFKLTFTFQRPWDAKVDDIHLLFKLGENPSRSKGTFVKINLEEGNDTSYMDGPNKKWGARILHQSGNDLTVAVYSPPNVVIGEWEFDVRSVMQEKPRNKIYQTAGKDDIIIILNPYCPDDLVYMPEQEDLREYIENEHGMVFYGSYKSIGAKPWNYGQFTKEILTASLFLLRKAFDYQISKKMSNPIEISRALSRILNDCDNSGVLSGNWSGNYEGGTSPLKWKGSVPILVEYMKCKEPVKYGQCWVFSHVLTTVARALGLPCRSVTNFASAHDTDESMTIDKYVDDDGDIIKGRSSDSIWNFHVWNEVWMKRPDLDKLLKVDGKYNGWHAVDATPQEKSDSIFQCGPSPLEAIRQGEVHIGYDTRFIFAEVNAEVCHWRDDGDEPNLVSHNSTSIGKNISTKTPTGAPMRKNHFGKWDPADRFDVTHLYKHPEGSAAEREAVENALSEGELRNIIFGSPTGITVEILPLEEPKVGQDFTVSVKVENTSDAKRVLTLTTNARPKTYWGEVIGTNKIASAKFEDVELNTSESKIFEIKIESDRVLAECDPQLAMSVQALAKVNDFDDHENRVFTSEDIQVLGPELVVKCTEEPVKAEHPVAIELEYTNPLDRELTNCVLSLQGRITLDDEEGFQHIYSIFRKTIQNIKPKETRKITVNVKPDTRPKKKTEREIQIGLNCEELPDIEGHCTITLQQ